MPSRIAGTLVELNFVAELHPGLAALRQRHLFVPAGREGMDFVVLSAEGTPEAIKAQNDMIQAIFASYQ